MCVDQVQQLQIYPQLRAHAIGVMVQTTRIYGKISRPAHAGPMCAPKIGLQKIGYLAQMQGVQLQLLHFCCRIW